MPPTGWDAPWGQGMRGDMWDAPGGGGGSLRWERCAELTVLRLMIVKPCEAPTGRGLTIHDGGSFIKGLQSTEIYRDLFKAPAIRLHPFGLIRRAEALNPPAQPAQPAQRVNPRSGFKLLHKAWGYDIGYCRNCLGVFRSAQIWP